jgi:hypothetical protein
MMWCIALFTTPAEADAILGDLQEERLAIATRDDERVATWWYRRQVLRTVAQLAMAPVREAPLTYALIGIVGFALLPLLSWSAFWLAGQVVVRVPMYQYVPATVFWRCVSLLPCVAVGTLIGVAMGSRAMSGALAVSAAMTVHAALINPMLLVARLPTERVPGALDYLAHTLPVFSMFVLALLTATAAIVALRPRRAHHTAQVVTTL